MSASLAATVETAVASKFAGRRDLAVDACVVIVVPLLCGDQESLIAIC